MATTGEKSARTRRRRHIELSTCLTALLAIAVHIPSTAADDVANAGSDARVANAWRVLRAVDCARCHGRDYSGLAAPSIVNFVASQNREMFIRVVLDGDPIRGMPGYRGNAYVVESLDDIYRYFVARANGEIGPNYRPPVPAERR